jgi:hypothetical protein
MADERDPENPLDMMMPPVDNPEYHRKKAEHQDKLASGAEAAILADPAHAALGDRLTSVRQGAPQAAAPQPLRSDDVPPRTPPADPQEHTGLTVDPSQAQVDYTPVEPTLPAGAAPQAAPAAPVPTAAPVPAAVNPILVGLRQDFGIESIPLTDVPVNNHVFTMKVLDVGAVTQALRFADTLSMPGSERENAINLQIALVSFAVLAIDKEPVWKVFDIAVPEESLVMVEGQKRPIFDPMMPPPGVRILGATSFMDFLSGQASSSLLAELWAQYGSKVDPNGSLDNLMLSLQDGEIEEPDLPLL